MASSKITKKPVTKITKEPLTKITKEPLTKITREPLTKITKKRANFQLLAPGAQKVYVAGTFNDWDPSSRQLKHGKDDVFKTWMNLPTGSYEYRFVVDGEWHEDPDCDHHSPSPYGGRNSVLVV